MVKKLTISKVTAQRARKILMFKSVNFYFTKFKLTS